jgi:23S rRNA (cytosine1962-C5)-methyltransferase
MNSHPKIILKHNREIPFLEKHPWLFSGAVEKITDAPQDGDEVAVFSNKGVFIAYGLYNSKSQIIVRLYSWDAEKELTQEFFIEKIKNAVNLRKNILGLYNNNSACRLIFSEGDGLSGLTVDRYNDFLIFQITSLALYKKIDMIRESIIEICKPEGIYLRTEKGIGETEGLMVRDGHLWGKEIERPVKIVENDIIFEADLRTGQKTGFYTDQRENRRAVREFASGKNVLDMCCYSGGFSINCAKYGAVSVTGIDVSENALEIARKNAALNDVKNAFFEKSDAFKYLENSKSGNKKFDLIVLDPPKFSYSKASSSQAIKGYIELNYLAMDCIATGGILATCSCSGRVSREEFLNAVRTAALKAKKFVRIIEFRGQAKDHPVSVSCPESNYLKCLICEVS